MLRLFDTALGRVTDVVPEDQTVVSIYVCGPTVYDLPHLGHGRSVLVYDVLRRYLEWKGHEVRFVSNVTDIDDKIIQRALSQGRSTDEVVAENEAAYWKAVDRLGVKRPTSDPHATAYLGRMVELIDRLASAGFTYQTSDGVYFEVERVPGYGLLARQSLDSLRAGARVDVAEEKRSPLDFVLWKNAKPGEVSWSSPWGQGRPGWHTECVVMSLDLLGDGFDIHAGGMDLQFPHHENERAQAIALGYSFARHWMHHAFVEVEGEKMSKSLGNFTTLEDLLSRADPRAYRLLVLRSHYRAPIEVTPTTTADATAALGRLDEFSRKFRLAREGAVADPDAIERFHSLMDDDLQTPAVMALTFDLVRRANASDDLAAAAAAFVICDAVGLALHEADEDVDDATAALVRARDEARGAKRWADADEIRDRLQAAGWVVKDTPAGTVVHR